jgi:hypothetical protein
MAGPSPPSGVKPPGACGPCGVGGSARRGPAACACAPGTRASSSGADYSAGMYVSRLFAFVCQQVDGLPVGGLISRLRLRSPAQFHASSARTTSSRASAAIKSTGVVSSRQQPGGRAPHRGPLRTASEARPRGLREWRRGWDSNPRTGRPVNGFRDRPIRPLWHLSGETLVGVVGEIHGGEGGIRTHGRGYPTHAFQACSLSHSDTSPVHRFLDEPYFQRPRRYLSTRLSPAPGPAGPSPASERRTAATRLPPPPPALPPSPPGGD